MLASKKGVSLRKLAEMLGISHAAMFGYRSGRQPVSKRAWFKLEQFERELSRVYANILNDPAPPMLKDAETPHRVNLKSPPPSAMYSSETERLLARIATALERLADQQEKKSKP